MSAELFALGQTVITRNALDALHPEDVFLCLGRHKAGIWGDLGQEDQDENARALREGGRLFSRYHDRGGVSFYIITEADRSATTVLLPEDY